MNNDRRTFLDGSKSPRKPLTEAKMIKYPADLEHKDHRDMTPAEKQRWIAYNRAYNQAVQTRDYSGIETSPSLGTKSKEYQDAWKAWNKQKTKHAANRDFHLIKPFVAPKEKTKKTKGGKKAYFMDYPNKYEEVTTEANAAGDQLNELQTRGRYLQVDPKASNADLKADRKGREERKSKKVYGMHGKELAPSAAAYYKQHPRQRGLLHDPSTAGDTQEEVTTKGYTELLEVALITLCNKYELDLKTLLVELQTPERRDEMERLYLKAEDKFMRNIGSDALMNALNAIDKKNYTEVGSKLTYGKGGKIVKRAK